MPFCKFCKDAGKSQREFTSHYPKDKPGKNGKVICPTILNNECRYCHEKGHAKSHCPILKAKNSRRCMTSVHKRSNRRQQQKGPNSVSSWTMTTMKQQHPRIVHLKREEKKATSFNAFAVLHQDDDEVETGPGPTPMKVKKITGCWGKKPDLSNEAVLKKLASRKQEMAVEEDEPNDMIPLLSIKEAYAKIKQTPTYIGSWADAIDSDSESDCEEDEIVLDNYGRPATDNSAW